MKITQRDGRVYLASEPDAEGVMACTEAQQLANSLQATVRVVETTISVHDTFHPQEKQP